MEQKLKPILGFRFARLADAALLSEMNYQLIRDEGHSNPMTLPELLARMKYWLSREYQGVLFEHGGRIVAYAIYRLDPGSVYLRQFFVRPAHRQQGIGRAAMQILLEAILPPRTQVTVEVLYNNKIAHQFWRAVGFNDYSVTLQMNR